jgi:hypothetical protein
MSSANRTRTDKESPMPRVRMNTVRRAVLTLALATAAAIGVTAPASADIFSPFFTTQTGRVGDCGVAYGPVKDPFQTGSAFAAIGGFQINCTYKHSYINASVWQASSTDGVHFYWEPTGRSFNAVNTTGYGYGILETAPSCGNKYWYTYAVVTVSGYAATSFTSYSRPVNATWCR